MNFKLYVIWLWGCFGLRDINIEGFEFINGLRFKRVFGSLRFER